MFIIISLFFIIKSIFCEGYICNEFICSLNKNVTIKNDNNEKLLIYSSGLTNRNITYLKENENTYDYNFLKDLFYNLECPYFFKNDSYIYIGLHISFKHLTNNVLNHINNDKLKDLVKKYKNNESLYCLDENEIDNINNKYLNYIIDKYYDFQNNISLRTIYLAEYLLNQKINFI